MTEAIEPQFITSNVLLVAALSLMGVPWADPNEECLNLYDEETMDRLRKQHNCQTAKEAVKRKIPGRVHFVFKQTEELSGLLAAWDVQQKAIKAAPKDEPLKTKLDSMDSGEAMQLCCQVLKNYVDVKGMWLRVPAKVAFGNKIMPVDASPELRRKMGV